MEYTIRIGGEAGQGIQTIGSVLARVFATSGLYVFTHQDYMSRIRGGHNYYQIRVSDVPVHSSRSSIDILVALNDETIELHRSSLAESAIVVFDRAQVDKPPDDPSFLNIPFLELAEKHGGDKIMANTVAIGAVLGMLQADMAVYDKIIVRVFSKKGTETVEANIRAARAGYNYARENCPACSFFFEKDRNPNSLYLLNGNQAIGYGALVSGCKFYSAYPMTPSTGIMIYLASKAEEHGIIVEQAEDEISAINMALGASFAGVRAMTGTSGGGYALMVEGVSLAGMTETPIVIAEVQRPGPATGLPTRTEQGDLLFVLHSGHGEFPRVLFAPGSPEQAIHLTNKAFHLAEKYQIPAFILSDQYLADSEWAYPNINKEALKNEDFRLRSSQEKPYRRYSFTENGVSPLAVPGKIHGTVVADSDEHDEEGHIIEDAETRLRMVEKRLLKKLPHIIDEISPPELIGDDNPEIMLVGWGSTYGLLKDLIDELSEKFIIGAYHFSEIFPLPIEKLGGFLVSFNRAHKTFIIENNATGQFERFLKAELGISFSDRIRKYDGRPFLLDELVSEITRIINR